MKKRWFCYMSKREKMFDKFRKFRITLCFSFVYISRGVNDGVPCTPLLTAHGSEYDRERW